MAAPRTHALPTCPQPLTVRLRQLTQDLLQLLPGGDALAHRRGQGLRHVVTARGPFGSAKTHVEMGAMLMPPVAAAAGTSTGAIGLGEGAEEDAPGQGKEAAEESNSAGPGIHNRLHRLCLYRPDSGRVKRKSNVWTATAPPEVRKYWLK